MLNPGLTGSSSSGAASARTSAKRSYSRNIIALFSAFACGSAVDLALTPICFRTDAVVEITTKDPAFRVAMTQAAIEVARSKPVLLRAAAVLSDMPAPEPDAFESMAVTLGISGTHPTGRDARLAKRLIAEEDVLPGELPGTIDIAVRDPNASASAKIANAVTDAFIADQDDRVADLRQRREMSLATSIDQLRSAALAAHARLSALGDVGADPGRLVALATNRRVDAQARLDAVRVIMASGSPPLSDRKDLPDAIATLQRTYLDLSGQLLKARETLGDRHTTIISLKEGVARASSNLVAEWKQVERIARGELEAARLQEASLRKTNPAVDVGRQTAIEAARLAVQQADRRVASAEAARDDTSDDGMSYRLLSRASVPVDAIGFSQQARAAIATVTSLTVLVILGLAFGFRKRSKRFEPNVAQVTRREVRTSFAESGDVDRPRETGAPAPPIRRLVEPKRPRKRRFRASEGVSKAAASILAALETADPRYGVSTVMIAGNETDTESRPVAVDLAYSIATSGRRVLLIEGPRFEPELAAIADPDAEPILADLFGTLRVMFRSDAEHGILYVAPSFKNEARIASVLARDDDMPLVDEIAREFDVVIYDGGRAGALDIVTDLYLRVGRFESARADAQFLEAFGEPDGLFIGTMVGNVFAMAEHADASPVETPMAMHEPAALAPLPPIRAPADRSRHVRFERAAIPRGKVLARHS